jgi:hypothetical protein
MGGDAGVVALVCIALNMEYVTIIMGQSREQHFFTFPPSFFFYFFLTFRWHVGATVAPLSLTLYIIAYNSTI